MNNEQGAMRNEEERENSEKTGVKFFRGGAGVTGTRRKGKKENYASGFSNYSPGFQNYAPGF